MPLAGDLIRASDIPRILAVATPLTTSVGPTSGTTELDVITAPAITPSSSTRRIRIWFHCRGFSGGTAGEQFVVRIKEGATTLQEQVIIITTASLTNTGTDCHAIVDAPSVASHTYKATIQRTSGTGTVSVAATAGGPITLTVEDCGATT